MAVELAMLVLVAVTLGEALPVALEDGVALATEALADALIVAPGDKEVLIFDVFVLEDAVDEDSALPVKLAASVVLVDTEMADKEVAEDMMGELLFSLDVTADEDEAADDDEATFEDNLDGIAVAVGGVAVVFDGVVLTGVVLAGGGFFAAARWTKVPC